MNCYFFHLVDESVDMELTALQTINQYQEDIDDKQLLQNKLSSQSKINEPSEKILNASKDYQLLVTNNSSDLTKPSISPALTTNESLNFFNSQPITTHKHPSIPVHLFSQILTPDNNVFSPHHQHFSYPFFILPGKFNFSTKMKRKSLCFESIYSRFSTIINTNIINK